MKKGIMGVRMEREIWGKVRKRAREKGALLLPYVTSLLEKGIELEEIIEEEKNDNEAT